MATICTDCKTVSKSARHDPSSRDSAERTHFKTSEAALAHRARCPVAQSIWSAFDDDLEPPKGTPFMDELRADAGILVEDAEEAQS